MAISNDTLLPLLSALLAHPEFAEGVRAAHESFFDSYDEAPLSEEEMVDEVEMNLSRRVTERSKQLLLLLGGPPSSYFYNLGYTFGTIDKGLTCTGEAR